MVQVKYLEVILDPELDLTGWWC